MASSKKKFSYLAIVAGAVMLVMTFATPPAFAAEGGDSGLSKPILALAAAIAIAGGVANVITNITAPATIAK
jgi:predicted phage tail protein